MKKIFLLLAAFAIIGCSNAQNEAVPVQKSNLTVAMAKSKVIQGQSTQNDIIEVFGSPNLITTNSLGEEVWTYSKSSYSEKNKSGSAGVGVPIFAVFGAKTSSAVSDASTSSFDLIITFNKQGIVEKYKVISAAY